MFAKTTTRPAKKKANALLFVTQRIGPDVLPHLLQRPNLNIRAVCDSPKSEFSDLLKDGVDLDRIQWIENAPQDPYRNESQMVGHKLAQWADFLFIVMDASMTALMLSGLTTDVILHVLRCWDTSKRIIMLPEMSLDQWKHPVWKKQLSKLQRKWDWVHVIGPALWQFASRPGTTSTETANSDDNDGDIVWEWDGPNEMFEAIHSETQSVLRLGKSCASNQLAIQSSSTSRASLPPEVWTIILDHLGDWELATALGTYTHLSIPQEWEELIPTTPTKPLTLEYTILTQPVSEVIAFFTTQNNTHQPRTTLSPIAARLIFRFALTDTLTYLALHQKDIFWTSFGLALLPHKASLIYNSPAILQWWKDCPAVIKKEYGPEALDGASRAGFVEVLEWWLNSGLQLWYTDKALESASAKGHVDVLEWWRVNSLKHAGTSQELPMKVGKSILLAAQSGRTESIAWWENSGIPYSHEDGVARLASTHGHVEVLELWHSLKGSKMIFDNQVLVGATKNGHAGVLEWWKQASKKWGFRVEYKTCDIEEAMEDAVGGGGEGEVREWWGRNGLNLGVGTGEWMRVKTL